MVECKTQKNKAICTCSYPCSKKGMCCECISYHRIRHELPACFFPDALERTYDRSIEKFIEWYHAGKTTP